MPNIPEKIHSFRAYSNGDVLATGDELTLPSVENKTITIAGAGILGEYDSVAEGHVSNMEQGLPFNTLSVDYFNLVEKVNNGADITIRAALQTRDAATGVLSTVPIKITERGSIKAMELGSVKNADAMSSSITINLTYLKIEINGKSVLEIDRLNMVYKINGVDRLKTIRDQC